MVTAKLDPNAAKPDPNADVAQLGYEAARDELLDIVGRLEGGRVGLEESLQLWTRGEALAAHCTAWLDRAQAQLSGQGDDSASTA